jgi:hypothetical protein
MNLDALLRHVRPSVRLVLDCVTYTNPLPEWRDEVVIDWDARESHILQRIRDYLSGRARPKPATPIDVPRRNNATKRWALLSVNDQIVLQTCALAIAHVVEPRQVVDYGRVFSYTPNTDPNRLAFTTSQLRSWAGFRARMNEKVRRGAMLQMDLEEAFASIDTSDFLRFFREKSGDGAHIDLLELLLGAWSVPGRGIPLVNESLFYLGNVYLSRVDAIVARHAPDYIRYVDDYRMYDPSRDRLAAALERITADLRELGLRPNPVKTRLGDEHEYLGALAGIPNADISQESYIHELIFEDTPEPEALVPLIVRTLQSESDLSEGRGRYLMQMIRRMQVQHLLLEERGQDSPLTKFEELLAESATPDVVEPRMKKYLDGREEWRLIWLYYCSLGDFQSVDADALPPIAAAWVRPKSHTVGISELHDLGYLEAGQALAGG